MVLPQNRMRLSEKAARIEITMVIATRIAEIAVIAPFRYSRLLFAMLLAVIVFGERPDATTLAGAALIAGAGIYSMWREARLRRARLAAA